MKRLFLIFSGLFSMVLGAQNITDFDPQDILVAGEELPQVLLVGSFHMNYPNLDAHVTDESLQVNVDDQKRRNEMRELMDYIARFKPTKIVVERHPGSNVNDRYANYLRGEFKLGKSEIYQIGFRLGKRFGIKELIPGDAPTLVTSLWYHRDSSVLHPLLDSIYADFDFNGGTEIDRRFKSLYAKEDEMLADNTLLDYFKYMNNAQRIKLGHGAYLAGEFQTSDHAGPDALAMHWYARNLRIARHILLAATSPDDRIMVLFGAGHLGILHQQLESYPGVKLVEFGELEEWR